MSTLWRKFLARIEVQRSGKAIFLWLFSVLLLKFLLFDLFIAIPTTFSAFQFPVGWGMKVFLAMVLTVPVLLIRRKGYIIIISIVVDLWLISNLMYFTNYYTVIPVTSYGLIGNLADFKGSVWEAVRWEDLSFPFTTLCLIVVICHTNVRKAIEECRKWCWKCSAWVGGSGLALAIVMIALKGGYKESYEKTQYDYSMVIPSIYTIPGTWIYSWIASEPELTPEIKSKIDSWIKEGESAPVVLDKEPENCIIILCESLESWILEKKVDGKEITPNLNKLLKERDVLYAPHVLTQVKDARSIDAQLFLHAGLMPVNYGAYSYRFPHHSYMTLDKAWKEKYPGGKSYSFTVDKRTVWNAAIVAQDFGYDGLLDKREWKQDQATGPRNRLGDESFLRQAYGKLKGEEIFPAGGHTIVQLVTYSGHTPFLIPDELKGIRFAESSPYPDRLKRYMETANYTDRAIGAFIDSIRGNAKFANTMIVITGDHEGIGIDRGSYLKVKGVKDYLSPYQFTPFIVLNSPVKKRYEPVMGQVDMYPTLLDLLGLNQYKWRGQGRSILRKDKKGYAISPRLEIVGDITGVSQGEIEHYKRAYEVGDLIISTNYFKGAY